MKKASLILLTIFVVYLLFPASAGARPDAKDSPFLSNPPQTFTVKGYIIAEPDTHHPYHALQQTVTWTFTDDKEIHNQFKYSIPEGSEGGPSEHTVDIYLTYDRELVNSPTTLFFITGRYSHKIVDSRTTIVHNGFLKGELLPIFPEKMGFISDYHKANALVFQMTPFGIIWDWKLIYEIEGEGYVDSTNETAVPGPTATEPAATEPASTEPSKTTSPATPDPNATTAHGGTDYPDYDQQAEYDDGCGCSRLLPDPGPPLKIGFGVALVIICIFILNKITGTFIYDDVKYNILFDPSCPYILKETKGNPIIGITGLLQKLREMLVNDGRDYAAGKRVGITISDEKENSEESKDDSTV